MYSTFVDDCWIYKLFLVEVGKIEGKIGRNGWNVMYQLYSPHHVRETNYSEF